MRRYITSAREHELSGRVHAHTYNYDFESLDKVEKSSYVLGSEL